MAPSTSVLKPFQIEIKTLVGSVHLIAVIKQSYNTFIQSPGILGASLLSSLDIPRS